MAEEIHYGVTDEGHLVEVHDAGSTGHVLDKMHAIVAVDKDGNEGIMGMKTDMGWVPFVAADLEKIELMRPHAEKMIGFTDDHTVKVVEFSTRKVLSTYDPKES